jgi:hypothetical protein
VGQFVGKNYFADIIRIKEDVNVVWMTPSIYGVPARMRSGRKQVGHRV